MPKWGRESQIENHCSKHSFSQSTALQMFARGGGVITVLPSPHSEEQGVDTCEEHRPVAG